MPLPECPVVAASPGIALTDRFREIGLTREFIHKMTERGDDLLNPLRATREAELIDNTATFALRLFLCAGSLTRAEAVHALGSRLFQRAIEAKLLVVEDGNIRCPFHMRSVRDFFLFSDYLAEDRDAVMGAGETTGLLYQASNADRPIGRVLDLGCGAGTIAFLLASNAARVLGSDINARAIAIAEMNASINGILNAEFRTGGLYEPLIDQEFDVVVSQPPYYPAPPDGASELVYLHGGPRGDELALKILDGLGDHLTRGGRGLLFTSWPAADVKTAPAGMRVFELTTNRREIHGTRQSLNIIEHANGGDEHWTTFEVPADDWGAVQSRRIDQLMGADDLLRQPQNNLLNAALRLPQGAACFFEGDQLFLQFPPQALVGCINLREEVWELLQSVDASPAARVATRSDEDAAIVVDALKKGWLFPAIPV